ncbi:MAG: two-component regulator propeller domain-containing protein, partial [Mucilaginibacter sp.]
MRVKFYFLVGFALIVACVNALGQSSQYRFSHLDVSDGLSHNQVNCVFKDSQGFMWFGTASGLNRFDGYTFKVFKHDSNDKNSISDDFVTKIFEGPDKKLWIESRGGYCFYDPDTEKFNSDMSLVLRPLKLPLYQNVTRIVRTGVADFWFLIPDSGIYRYNSLTGQTKRYYHNINSVPSLYSSSVADIAPDAKGNLWIMFRNGTIEMLDNKLNKISNRTDVFNKEIHNKNGNYSLIIDRDNDLWLYESYVESGVFYYKPSTAVLRHIDKESVGVKLKANVINNIIQADDGLIWIATDHGGINVLDKKGY